MSTTDYASDKEIRELFPYVHSIEGADKSLICLYLLLRAPTLILTSPSDKTCRLLAIASRSLLATGRADSDVFATARQLEKWTIRVRECLTLESLRRRGIVSYKLQGDPLSADGAVEVRTIPDHSGTKGRQQVIEFSRRARIFPIICATVIACWRNESWSGLGKAALKALQ